MSDDRVEDFCHHSRIIPYDFSPGIMFRPPFDLDFQFWRTQPYFTACESSLEVEAGIAPSQGAHYVWICQT